MATSTAEETVPQKSSNSREEAARTAAAAGLAVAAPPISMNHFPVDLETAFDGSNGHEWQQEENMDYPQNNISAVFTAFTLIAIVGALDMTIVSVALPTIVKDLNGERAYSWVGASYLLASASVAPIYLRMSHVHGRKPVLIFSILLHVAASALCGFAKNFVWLSLCRGLQGLAAGGMTILSMNTIVDISPSLANIGRYSVFLSFITAISSVVGPFIGAALTEHATWRLIFWINIPIGGAALIMLVCFLNLKHKGKRPLTELFSTFDFLGLILPVVGVALLLVGFQEAQTASGKWHNAATIVLVIFGVLLFIMGIITELYTNREPLFPKRLFKTRTTFGITIAMFILSLVSAGAAYYLPLYFQMLGASPIQSATRQFALVVGSMLTSAFINPSMRRTGRHRPFAWAGAVMLTVGFGVMIMLEEDTPVWEHVVILLVAGFGIGSLAHPLFAGLESATPLKDMGSILSAASFIRMLGGAIGISLGDVIFASELPKRLLRIDGVDPKAFATAGGQTFFVDLSHITPEAFRDAILHAHTRSLATVWIVFCALAFVALLCVLPIRENGVKPNRVTHEMNNTHPVRVPKVPTVTIDPAAVASPIPVDLTRVPRVAEPSGSAPVFMRYPNIASKMLPPTNSEGAPLTRTTSEMTGLSQGLTVTKPPPARRHSSQSQ